MNFKVKKAYYRLFSVLLSLVMIVLSVPISASAELSSDDATEASESVQSENLGKIESEEISLPINPAEMTAVTDDIITDGVYAFRNVNNPDMWLDTGYSSPLPDSYMQQYAYWTSPAATNAFFVGGLFKIKRLGSTANSSYVIRLMTNNELIFRPNTTTGYVNSMKVSPVDTEVYSANRYLLQKTEAGYIIKLLGSPYCIATPQSNVSGEGTVASRLTYLSPTEAQTNTRAQWQLYKYEGSPRGKVALSVSPDEMVPNETTTVSGYLSSTLIGFNGPVNYSVSGTYDMITDKATVNSTSGELTANAVGEIKLWVNSGTYTNYKIIKIAENISGAYFFNNVEYPNKYVQINNVDNMNDPNVIIELHKFNGYYYQRWDLVYLASGYYKIISQQSTLALTAPTGANNDVVTQTSYTGANTQLWKFIKQSDGTYKISPMSNLNCFLAAGDVSSVADQDLEIRSVQSDGSDEWNLCRQDLNVVNLEVVCDVGYSNRYSNATERLNLALLVLQEKFLREFGIWINYSSPTINILYGDQCSTDPYTECTHATNEQCYNSNSSSSLNNYHHKNIFNIIERISRPDTSSSLKVVFIGHDNCLAERDDSGNLLEHDTNPFYGIAYTNYGLACVMNFENIYSERKTLVHEFGHLFGAIDHYGGDGWSTNRIQLEYLDSEYNKNCIYGENKDEIDVYQNVVICDGCKDRIRENLNRYDHN